MNYSELQDTVARWMNRDDMTTEIQEGIRFAEREMNRLFRTGNQEANYVFPGENIDYYTLPADFRKYRSVDVDGDVIRYQTPFGMLTTPYRDEQSEGAGTPWFYTFAGDQIIFDYDVSDQSFISLVGYLQVPALTDTLASNWVIEQHEDAYVNGAMKYAHLKAKNYKDSAIWENGFKTAMDKIIEADKRDRWSGAPLSIKSDVRYKNRSNRRRTWL